MPTLDFLTTGILSQLEILADDTKTVLWAAHPTYTKVFFVSSTYRDIWGRDSIAIYRSYLAWRDYLIPQHKSVIYNAFMDTPINPKHTVNYCIILPDQSEQLFIDRSFAIYDSENEPLLMAGVALPISQSQLTGEANIRVSDFMDTVIIQYYNILVQNDHLNYFNEAATFSKEISLLSKREKEILKLILSGLTASQIAKKIFVSRRTVEAHTNAIKQKFHCDSKSEIILKAIENNCTRIIIE